MGAASPNSRGGLPSRFTFDGKLTGTSWLFLGFAAGALFALLPVYYYYTGREAELRSAPGAAQAPAPSRQGGVPPKFRERGAPNRFAARMTYELNHLPRELPRARVKPPVPSAVVVTAPAISSDAEKRRSALAAPTTATAQVAAASRVASTPPAAVTPPVATPRVTAPPAVTATPVIAAAQPVTAKPPVTATAPVTAAPVVTATAPTTSKSPVGATPPVTATPAVSATPLVTAKPPIAATPPVTAKPPVSAAPQITAKSSVTATPPVAAKSSLVAVPPAATALPVAVTPPALPTPSASATTPVRTASSPTLPPAGTPAPTRAAQFDPVAALPGPRVANPRPISTEPPDPRDTTREIEKAARQRDFPDGRARAERKTPDKAIELAALGVAAESARKPIETRTIVGGSGGAPVAPVKPITPAPEPSQRGVLQAVPSAPITLARVEPVVRGAPAAPRVEPTVASAAPAPSPGGADRDIIEGRLSATRDWLAAAPQATHTIQIMGSNNEQQLRNHLKSLSTVLDPNRIFVFRTVAQGKPATTVVYGAYADRESALRALAKLPTSLTANRPVLRTVNGIRAEMKQHGKS